MSPTAVLANLVLIRQCKYSNEAPSSQLLRLCGHFRTSYQRSSVLLRQAYGGHDCPSGITSDSVLYEPYRPAGCQYKSAADLCPIPGGKAVVLGPCWPGAYHSWPPREWRLPSMPGCRYAGTVCVSDQSEMLTPIRFSPQSDSAAIPWRRVSFLCDFPKLSSHNLKVHYC